MQRSNTVPLFKVDMSDNVPIRVRDTVLSGVVTQGPRVKEFESNLGKFWQNNNVVTTNSCTSALHLAFHLIKQHPEMIGDTVVASPLTCAAGIFPIVHNGLKIKWADVDDTINIDLDNVCKQLTSRTQILTFVHWGGMPVDFDKLQQIKEDYAKVYGKPLFIVEDCAHAINSQWDRDLITTVMPENFKCFSFQAIKHLTTGDGGALVCGDEYYRQARLLRWFGLDRDNKEDFRSCQDIQEAGFKFHMNDIAATIGIGNLVGISENLKKCEINAIIYDAEFKDLNFISIPKRNFKASSSWWLYTILVEDRENFIKYMAKNNIECSPVHRRNDTLSCLKQYGEIVGNIDTIDKNMVSIPVGHWLKDSTREMIIDRVKRYVKI